MPPSFLPSGYLVPARHESRPWGLSCFGISSHVWGLESRAFWVFAQSSPIPQQTAADSPCPHCRLRDGLVRPALANSVVSRLFLMPLVMCAISTVRPSGTAPEGGAGRSMFLILTSVGFPAKPRARSAAKLHALSASPCRDGDMFGLLALLRGRLTRV